MHFRSKQNMVILKFRLQLLPSSPLNTISLHGVSDCEFAKQIKKIVMQKGLITEISTDEGKSSQTIHGIKITFVILS